MNELISLLTLPVLKAELKAIVTRAIWWNSFPGSVIHGVLGYALKDYSCVVAHRNCKNCYLVNECNYGMIFESPLPEGTQRMKLYPQAPHPIKLTVYPWDKAVLREGEHLTITITLYGKATVSLLMVLLSLERAFAEGIGRRSKGVRGSAVILSLTDCLRNRRYDWVSLKANYQNPISVQPLSDIIITPCASEISMRFKSPLKIVTEGRVNFNPSVRDVAANILRRLGNLHYFYERRELRLDFEKILTDAEGTEFESHLQKVSAIRYSSRQSQTISVAGLVGDIEIKNISDDLAQLLLLGQSLGVGKSTTMGLGDYEVRKL